MNEREARAGIPRNPVHRCIHPDCRSNQTCHVSRSSTSVWWIHRAKNEAAEKIHRQVRIKITPVQLSRLSACLDRRLLLKAQGEIPRRRAFSRPCTPGAPSRSIAREERQSKHLPALELHVRRAHVHAHTGQTDTRFIRVRVHVRREKTGATSRLSTVATLTP